MYTKAIEECPEDYKLYSNRFSAYYKVQQYHKAMQDADRCTKLRPKWWKGWYRKGQAAQALGDVQKASMSYLEAAKFCEKGTPEEKLVEKANKEILNEMMEQLKRMDKSGKMAGMFNKRERGKGKTEL